jgi:hypothetical protein
LSGSEFTLFEDYRQLSKKLRNVSIQGAPSDKSMVQPERVVIFIREAGMRPVGVKHLEQSIQIVLPVAGPLVLVDRQKSALRQPTAPVFAGSQRGGLLRINVQGDVAY